MRSVSHLRYPLDRIFAASSHIPILRALQNSREGMSGRAIAREARIDHQSCAVAVGNLEALGILQRQGGGRTQLIRLNFENILVKNSLLPLLRQERELLMKAKQEIVETFKDDALAMTLFGSAARGHDAPGSDLDVLLLVGEPGRNKIQSRAMAYGPAAGLDLVDRLRAEPTLKAYHLLPSVRGDLLLKLGRLDEARPEFERAASLTRNARERDLLLERAAACGGST